MADGTTLPRSVLRVIHRAALLNDSEKWTWQETYILSSGKSGCCFASAKTIGDRHRKSARTIELARERLQRVGLLASRRGFRRVDWFPTWPAGVPLPPETANDTEIFAIADRLDVAIQERDGPTPRKPREAPPRAGENPVPQAQDNSATDCGITTPQTVAVFNTATDCAPTPQPAAAPIPQPAAEETVLEQHLSTDAPCPPLPGENTGHVQRDREENSEPLTPERRRELIAEMKRDVAERLSIGRTP